MSVRKVDRTPEGAATVSIDDTGFVRIYFTDALTGRTRRWSEQEFRQWETDGVADADKKKFDVLRRALNDAKKEIRK